MDKQNDHKGYREEKPPKSDGKFGFCGFTPSCLQCLNNPWCFLVGVIGLTFGQGLAIIGILAIVMPQIEKRFNYSSLEVGMIAAANDVAALVFGLIISHYGNFGNKVKWIGLGGVVTSIGFMLFTLPHFIIGRYDPPDSSLPSLLCRKPESSNTSASLNTTVASNDCEENLIADWYYLAIMLIGQFVAGTGSISLFAFTPTCFQESVSDKNIPIFLGLWQASTFVGPLVAFGISEPLLELYVDITQPKGFNMTPLDPRWIGNWWVGILGAAGICLLSAIFISGFPRIIPSQRDPCNYSLQNLEASKHKTSESDFKEGFKNKFSEFPGTLKDLLTNWSFVLNCMAVNTTLMYAEGIAPFLAKILILQYGVEPQKVGNALTISVLPTMMIGVLGGIFMVRALKLEDSGRKSAFLCFIIQLFTIIGPLGFLLPGCNEINLAGLEVPYGRRTSSGKFLEYPAVPGAELGSICNQNCSCNLGIALPVCGSDNVTYLSPCYAGCSDVLSVTEFSNCSCIVSEDGLGTAKIGYCERDCKNWLWFLVLMAFNSLAFFMQLTPTKVVIMRIIPPENLSFAFGLQYMSTKIFAHIPGPILFGHLVDINCVIWQKMCDKTGFCWIYNLGEQTKMIVTVTGTLAGIGMLFFLISWLLYKEYEDPNKAKIAIESSNGLGFDNKGVNIKVEDTKI